MIYVFVGMPGSGKSCMVRAIYKKLNMQAVDVDKLIEARYGLPLHKIVGDVGPDKFKEIEEETLLTVDGDDLLVATGGSAIYSSRAMERFKRIGKIIYLYVGFETMLQRLGDFSKRGIVMRPDQTIRDVYDEREALYRKYADVTVDCDGVEYHEYRRRVAEAIKSIKNKHN